MGHPGLGGRWYGVNRAFSSSLLLFFSSSLPLPFPLYLSSPPLFPILPLLRPGGPMARMTRPAMMNDWLRRCIDGVKLVTILISLSTYLV